MTQTKIEWADEVWNPVTGCTKVSEGCANCYAERMARRLAGRYGYPKDEPFRVTFHPERLEEPLRWKKPRRVFVCSMGDLFHPLLPVEYLNRVFSVMEDAYWHKFIVLTKRSDQMELFFRTCRDVPDNVWLLVSVENQKWLDLRIKNLLQINARVKGVSIEPMLGPVDLGQWLVCQGCGYLRKDMYRFGDHHLCGNPTPILDWVILGGETGPGARPMHPYWVKKVRDDCQTAGVPFFFKQWGEWAMGDENYWQFPWVPMVVHPKGIPQPLDRSFVRMIRVGKKAAGRLLDGRLWEEWPE